MTNKDIRRRNSYYVWNELYNFCRNRNIKLKTTEDLLGFMHNLLDSRFQYGQRQRARWSKESLELLLEDVKTPKQKIYDKYLKVKRK